MLVFCKVFDANWLRARIDSSVRTTLVLHAHKEIYVQPAVGTSRG